MLPDAGGGSEGTAGGEAGSAQNLASRHSPRHPRTSGDPRTQGVRKSIALRDGLSLTPDVKLAGPPLRLPRATVMVMLLRGQPQA